MRFLLVFAGLTVSYFVYGLNITSINSGRWNQASTWDCGCVPSATDNVTIAAGHSVDLRNNTTVNNLTIESGGALSCGGNTLTIDGDLVLNGELNNNRKKVFFNGNTISGTGIKTGKRNFQISAGTHIIAAGSNLNFSNGNILLDANCIIDNYGEITVLKDIRGTDATSTWNNKANSTLAIGKVLLNTGTLNASEVGNTISYYSTRDQNIKIPASTYYNLYLSGAGATKTLMADIQIDGTLTIHGTTLFTDIYSLSIKKDFINNGVFDHNNTATVTFNGTTDQTIGGLSAFDFHNFTVNKSSGILKLYANITVNNTLTLSAGTINTQSKKLTVGTSAVSTGNLIYTSGKIIGELERWIGSTGLVVFPMGSSVGNQYAKININALGSTGSLMLQFVETYPGNNGLPLYDAPDFLRNTFSEGYWQLTPLNGLVVTDYSITLDGNGFTSFSINGATKIIGRPNASSNWQIYGTHGGVSGTQIRRNNITTIPVQLAFADTTQCDPPNTSPIFGPSSFCSGTNQAFSVTNTAGSTYNWSVTGNGSIVSGNGTSNVTITFSGGGIDTISVQEKNSCTLGEIQTYIVTVETLPVENIAGLTAVPENSTSMQYYVPNAPAGYTYSWSVTGGTYTMGGSSDTIYVNWGSAGTGQICVTPTSPSCGSGTSKCININIYVVIRSITSGNWGKKSTWDCNCTPGNTDNVVISSTHTVSLTRKRKVNNLIIEPGATFNDNGNRMDVNGDIINDGLCTGTNRIHLNGINTYIDGSGEFQNNELRVQNGNKTISATSSLTINGLFRLNTSNITVYNNGRVTINNDIRGTDNTVSWVNNSNAYLGISGSVFPLSGASLFATATDNTVEYTSTTATQTVYPTDYYHLTISNTLTANLNSRTRVYGDLTISNGATFNSNNFSTLVYGNWNNLGGNYAATTDTVFFTGGSTHNIILSATKQDFNVLKNESGNTVSFTGTSDIINIVTDFINEGTFTNDGKIFLNTGLTKNTGTLQGNGIYELLAGNWANTGTFVPGTSTVIFSGAATQTISGNNTFYNVTSNNAASVDVLDNTSIKELLQLNNGTFNTNNLLTLASDASGTGKIGPITTAAITGNIYAQRYLSNVSGWRMMGSPVSGTTIADWDNELTTWGFPGSDYPSSSAFSVATYDEATTGTKELGYVPPSADTDPINVGQGYYVYEYYTPVTIDLYGTPNTGTINYNVVHTDDPGQPASEDGWNMVANPYPCGITWDLVGITSNISNFISIWDPTTSAYKTFDKASGTIIEQHQAFWVHVTAPGTGTLTFSETNKNTAIGSFYKSQPRYMDVVLERNGLEYKTQIRHYSDATNLYDVKYDGIYLPTNYYNIPNMWTKTFNPAENDTLQLAINSINVSDSAIVLPLYITNDVTDNFNLSFKNTYLLNTNSCVLVEDPYTGVTFPLKDTTLSITVYDTTQAPRLYFKIGKIFNATKQDVLCYGDSTGSISIDTSNDITNWNTYIIHNGDTVSSSLANQLPAGEYWIIGEDLSQNCPAKQIAININSNDSISIQTKKEDVMCYGEASGSIDIQTISGGVAPYTIVWNTGASTSSLNQLSAGIYTVNVTDSAGCTLQRSFAITEPQPLAVSSQINSPSCYGYSDGSIVIDVSGGNSPYSYFWNNNSSFTDIANNIGAGTYSVTITDANNCVSTQQITLNQPDELIASFSLLTDTFYINNDTVAVYPVNTTNSPYYSYTWRVDNIEVSSDIEPALYFSTQDTGWHVIELIVSDSAGCSASYYRNVYVVYDLVSGASVLSGRIEDVKIWEKENNKFIVEIPSTYNYPNVALYNMIGEKIDNYQVHQTSVSMDLNHLSSGVYIVKLQMDNKIISRKIVVH